MSVAGIVIVRLAAAAKVHWLLPEYTAARDKQVPVVLADYLPKSRVSRLLCWSNFLGLRQCRGTFAAQSRMKQAGVSRATRQGRGEVIARSYLQATENLVNVHG